VTSVFRVVSRETGLPFVSDAKSLVSRGTTIIVVIVDRSVDLFHVKQQGPLFNAPKKQIVDAPTIARAI
jgi:hypothetical protein